MTPPLPNRHTIRLQNYDYSSPGMYSKLFVILDCLAKPDDRGSRKILTLRCNDIWIPASAGMTIMRFLFEKYVIMPNHFHGMIKINNNIDVGAPLEGARMSPKTNNFPKNDTLSSLRAGSSPAPTKLCKLSNIVGGFKSLTNQKYYDYWNRHFPNQFTKPLWQRNYWEHIIRDVKDYYFHEKYILNNVINWAHDKLYEIS